MLYILESTSSENIKGCKYEIMTAKYLTKKKKKRQAAKNYVTGGDVHKELKKLWMHKIRLPFFLTCLQSSISIFLKIQGNFQKAAKTDEAAVYSHGQKCAE